MRSLSAFIYLIKEALPSFLLGSFLFISILLTFQILKLTEFILIHGIQVSVVFLLVFYLSISFLPMILPMSLLFSVLMTYGRLSTDSEIIAFKSLGLSQGALTAPAVTLGALVTLVSAQTYFFIGPWGQKQFTDLISEIGSTQVVSTIREGTFAEGFYNLVVYANKVNQKKGVLKDVFIYDERSEKSPITIIAQEGQILTPQNSIKSSVLRLFNGSIHRSDMGSYTKIKFENYDIFLTANTQKRESQLQPKAMNLKEIYQEMRSPDLDSKRAVRLQLELHKRWSLPFACFIFSMVGVGLGTVTNRRVARSGGFVLSVAFIVIYWILTVSFDNFASNGHIPPILAMWLPNFIFLIIAIRSLRSIWNK